MTRKEAMRQSRQEDVLMSLGFTRDEAEALRRISMTLHRWHEHECNGVIQREGDDGTGRPFWYSMHTGERISRKPAPDREKAALHRLALILARRNNEKYYMGGDKEDMLTSYVQGDPRGAALYILRPGDVPAGADASAYYSRGICVY